MPWRRITAALTEHRQRRLYPDRPASGYADIRSRSSPGSDSSACRRLVLLVRQ